MNRVRGGASLEMKGEALTSPARLLIVDDHELVREGMRTILDKELDLEVVGEAANGQEAVRLFRSLRPDLVLMDVRMPEMDGLEATREIKAERSTTSVLMLTIHENPDYLLDAIRAGAAGYVLKDATRSRLLEAIRRVLDGESPLNEELAMRLLRHLSKAGRQAEPSPDPASEEQMPPFSEPRADPLTARELDVLRVLVRCGTNREVAQELRLSLSTVKTHVHHLITKLKVSNRTQAVVRAIELGLISPREALRSFQLDR